MNMLRRERCLKAGEGEREGEVEREKMTTERGEQSEEAEKIEG